MFKWPDSEFRAYQGIFQRYESGRARLGHDLDTCRLEKRDRADWKYPVGIGDRIEGLNLRWPTYEELFSGIPSIAVSEGLQAFRERYGNIPQPDSGQAPASHELPALWSQNHPRSKHGAIVAFEPHEDRSGIMRDAQTTKPHAFRTADGWFAYNLAAKRAQSQG